MRRNSPLIVAAAVIACISSVSTLSVVAQTRDALGIADNDSVYIDAKSFKIVPGKAKGDTSVLIKKLDARNLDPGTIVFRSGDQLYIADDSPVIQAQLGDRYGSDRYGSDRYGSDRYGSDRYGSDRYGSDRYGIDRYGSDRYGSDRDTSVSAAQAERDWQEYRRQNRYGSDRYGSDRDTSVSAAQAERDWQEYLHGKARYGSDRVVIDDPEYADYKLKKIFSDNWSANESAR
jgi:hypothetical protein